MTNRRRYTEEEIQLWAYRLESKSPQELVEWALEQFHGEVVLASSFGAEDVVLIDMLHKVAPETPIFYLDTNKHFPETYETRDRLEERYGISFLQVLPRLTLGEQADRYGDKLWQSNPNQCCQIRKVTPLGEVLSGYAAWITGIRREQSPTRAHVKKIEWDPNFQLVKCNPLAGWTSDEVWSYIRGHEVPYNPLHDQHYPSIGCSVCTRQVTTGEDARAGRWSGFDKTECGLHK